MGIIELSTLRVSTHTLQVECDGKYIFFFKKDCIRPYLRRNLLRGCYSCRFFRDEKGVLRCKTNASSETFHKMIVFSRSDRDSEKYGIKYVPYNKINMELILNETPAYVVEKVAECYL